MPRAAVAAAAPMAALAGDLVGHGLCRLHSDEVPALRRRSGPVPAGWEGVSPAHLRNSDEQTIAGVAAVRAAMRGMGAEPACFEAWGVIAASRFVGRASLALALRQFAAEGVWGTSPHLIPHFALHSPSGTISLALGLHGPNLGVGGGRHATAEGFLAALTWVATGSLPGAWLVLSGWTPELVPDRRGGPPAAGECQALALALVAADGAGGRHRFRIVAAATPRRAPAPLDLAALAEGLEGGGGPAPRTIATDPAGRLGVEWVPAAAEPGWDGP